MPFNLSYAPLHDYWLSFVKAIADAILPRQGAPYSFLTKEGELFNSSLLQD